MDWQTVFYQIGMFFMQYPTKILLAELLFCLFAPRRKHFWLRVIPSVLLFLCLPYVVGYYEPWLTIGEWFTLAFLLQFIISIFIVLLCFEFSWQQTLFYCTAAYALEHCFDSIQRIVSSLIRGEGSSIDFLAWSGIYLGIMCAVYAVCYFFFVRKIRKLDESVIKSWFVIGLCVATILVVNILSIIIGHVGYDVYHKIYDAVACILLMVTQYSLFYAFEQAKKNEGMRFTLLMSEEQHRLAKENIELINLKCHDLKHQIAHIRHMIDDKKIEASLKEMEKSILIYDSVVKTGNATLDVILTEKKLFCERYGIRFSCIVDGSRLDFMDEEDIYALFGNALDNAVESVITLDKPLARVVSINVSVKGRMLSIHFDNYCGESLKFKNGLPISTKQDKKLHGYGMRSIRYVVNKYNGTMTVFVKNETFNLNVLFPLEEE